MEEQLKLDFLPIPVMDGDCLLVKRLGELALFFKLPNFPIENLPEGTLIEISAKAVMLGVCMPACQGTIHYQDGLTLFYRRDFQGRLTTEKCYLSKFWDGDVVTVLKLPQDPSASS